MIVSVSEVSSITSDFIAVKVPSPFKILYSDGALSDNFIEPIISNNLLLHSLFSEIAFFAFSYNEVGTAIFTSFIPIIEPPCPFALSSEYVLEKKDLYLLVVALLTASYIPLSR